MSTHTPGPWCVYKTSDSGLPAGPCVAINSAGLTLPASGPVVCIISDVASLNERDKANALLIAAAPDLLEALKTFRASLYFERNTEEVKRLTMAAIAKAEGR